MARIRTIKPEFFTSEDIVGLSTHARLLYIALWCEADKEGRLTWKPTTFKLRYLPADQVDIQELCSELVRQGVVKLYGGGLAWIPGFSKHQHVNPRESASDLPAPDGVQDAGPRKVGKTTREAVFERDGHKCVRCGSTEHLQVDHILPQSCGGPHIIENLRTLCRSCNAGRPVAGKALDADLQMDGHTVKSLQVKFGIDASILDLHTQVGREGKGREIYARPTDVSEQVWADFQQLRKTKKAPVNKTVIDGVRDEAKKVGLSLQDALEMQVRRGWQGFDSSWVTAANQPTNAFAGAI